jgi:hypothetical protein
MELFGHFKTLDEMTLRIVTHRGCHSRPGEFVVRGERELKEEI